MSVRHALIAVSIAVLVGVHLLAAYGLALGHWRWPAAGAIAVALAAKAAWWWSRRSKR